MDSSCRVVEHHTLDIPRYRFRTTRDIKRSSQETPTDSSRTNRGHFEDQLRINLRSNSKRNKTQNRTFRRLPRTSTHGLVKLFCLAACGVLWLIRRQGVALWAESAISLTRPYTSAVRSRFILDELLPLIIGMLFSFVRLQIALKKIKCRIIIKTRAVLITRPVLHDL